MNKIFIISCLLLCFSNVNAETCHYTLSSSKVEWTAYKTPKKVGVKGSFEKLEIKTKKEKSKSIEMAINGAKFTADSASVKTGNPDRDKKIVEFFFTKKDKAVEISGNVKSVKKDIVEVELDINGSKKVVPMTLAVKDNNATMTGSIDVMDFAMGDNLSALTEACKVQHEGKTWSTVDLSLAAEFTKTCK
jgi:hypothetical protein